MAAIPSEVSIPFSSLAFFVLFCFGYFFNLFSYNFADSGINYIEKNKNFPLKMTEIV